jgi:hypothetical protein
MNITIIKKKPEPKVLTVADMTAGMVYRVWSPLYGNLDEGNGQICLKLACDNSIVLAISRESSGCCPTIARRDAPFYCGHPCVHVAEVYGRLTGIEVTPLSEKE